MRSTTTMLFGTGRNGRVNDFFKFIVALGIGDGFPVHKEGRRLIDSDVDAVILVPRYPGKSRCGSTVGFEFGGVQSKLLRVLSKECRRVRHIAPCFLILVQKIVHLPEL